MAKIKHNHFIDSVDEMLATAVGLEAIVVGIRDCRATLRFARNDGGGEDDCGGDNRFAESFLLAMTRVMSKQFWVFRKNGIGLINRCRHPSLNLLQLLFCNPCLKNRCTFFCPFDFSGSEI
jgi:hypothetical protein